MAITIATIAKALGVAPLGNAELLISRPAEPAQAKPDELALATSDKWARALGQGQARAALLWPGADWQALGLEAAICPPRGRLAMAQVSQAFATSVPPSGQHDTAIIDAEIADSVSVGPFAVIAKDVLIGADSVIAAQVTIGPRSRIGRNCIIHPGARIGADVIIGDNCVIQPNAVIGADGFSFVTETAANEEKVLKTLGRTTLEVGDGTRHKIASLGGVVIGDDVEVGANSSIDAGTIRPTLVGDGCKIDNLVQVGHNVVLGRDCVLCAQAAVAGSAVLGDRVVMGGKSGIKDNVTIGRDVVLGGGAIVLGSVADGQFMAGHPAQPMVAHRAQQKALRKLTVPKPPQSD